PGFAADLSGEVLGGLTVEVADGDCGSGCREGPGTGCTDAGGASGDQRATTAQGTGGDRCAAGGLGFHEYLLMWVGSVCGRWIRRRRRLTPRQSGRRRRRPCGLLG